MSESNAGYPHGERLETHSHVNKKTIVKVIAITSLMCQKNASCTRRKYCCIFCILPTCVGNMLPAHLGKIQYVQEIFLLCILTSCVGNMFLTHFVKCRKYIFLNSSYNFNTVFLFKLECVWILPVKQVLHFFSLYHTSS